MKTYVAPLRVRGLKHFGWSYLVWVIGRTFTGAWIETTEKEILGRNMMSHLYGCVD